MRVRWLVVLMIVLMSAWACGGGEGSSTEEATEGEPVGSALTGDTGDGVDAEAQAAVDYEYTEEKALVQVLVSGLAVFNFDRSGDVSEGVFFPTRNGDTSNEHSVFWGVGTYDQEMGFRWDTTLIRNGESVDEDNLLRFPGRDGQLMGKTQVGNNPPAGGTPNTNEIARASDWRWTIKARRLGLAGTEFEQRDHLGVWLEAPGYTLETCSLSPDPSYKKSCAVTTKKLSHRVSPAVALSEAMVLRLEIDTPRTGDGDLAPAKLLSIDDSPEEVWPITLPDAECKADMKDGCVTWDKTGAAYKHVFDLTVRSVPSAGFTGGRKMESMHGDLLAALFPESAQTDWDVRASDCESRSDGSWDCDCEGSQPTCWTHFVRYHDEIQALLEKGTSPSDIPLRIKSPLDVAMCPFVQWP